MVEFSHLVAALRANLAAAGIKASHGQTQQLLASALGHGTLASLQASGDLGRLSKAHHVIVDSLLLQLRAEELGIAQAARVVEPVAMAFQAYQRPAGPFEGVHRWPDTFIGAVQDRLRIAAVSGEVFAGQLAMTNGTLGDVSLSPAELWESFDVDDDESIEEHVVGDVMSETDASGDRAYGGRRINVEATVSVKRLGKRLFGGVEVEVTRSELCFDV